MAYAKEAQNLLESALAHMEPNDINKRAYSVKVSDVYDRMIAILMKENRYDEAMAASEQARARASLDLLYTARAKKDSKAGVGDAAAGTAEQQTAAATSARTQELVLRSEAHGEAITPAQITDTLGRLQSTLIGYWVSDETLYTWVARPGQPTYGAARPLKRSVLEALVEQTQPGTANGRGGLRSRGGAAISGTEVSRTAWRRLYDLLILPVAEYLPKETGSRLTIIPSGPLFRVAFPALTDRSGHYLVERYATHSSPTIGLLNFTAENDEAAKAMTPHYVFVADPARFPLTVDGLRLPPLPRTEIEVQMVSRLLPTEQVTMLHGEDAGLRELTASLPTSTTLHFATHAVMSDSDPFGSFLALNREGDSGRLTVSQVCGMHLHARLVALSACRTGLEKISGDGVAGLSRAFFYAGTASVLATLWDVADEPTARLLPKFYEQMNHGATRSDALRRSP